MAGCWTTGAGLALDPSSRGHPTAFPLSAREPDQIAPLRLLQRVVPNDLARLLQPAEQPPHPSPDRGAAAHPASAGDEPDNATGTGPELGAEKVLGIGDCLEHGLTMKIESG